MKASKIITILNFHAKKLNNNRDIYVYLPPSYDTETDKRYPVLYMHDGQYLFKPSENTGGSWDVHKAADRLITEGRMKEIIIVGIPNMGSERGSEYAHHEIAFIRDLNAEAKGLLYEDFLINDLKPYIDLNFRTLTDSSNTALMGSSMGGLVTYNIGFRNPDIFGKLGILSPFLVSVEAHNLQESDNYTLYKGKRNLKVWVDIGEVEGHILVSHVRKFVDELIGEGFVPGKDIAFYNVPDAAHFESEWAARIHDPLLYFFGEIGKPVSVKLLGRKTVGLNEINVKTNSVVKYDTGFEMSNIDGKYEFENTDILDVTRDGTIIPKMEGKTNVTFIIDDIKVTEEYTVVKALSELVNVKINVKVPENTPVSAKITFNGLELQRIDNCSCRGIFKVPRDSAFAYKIMIGNSFVNPIVERDSNDRDIPYRRFKATEDVELNCIVENWKKM